jgi:hypothetical protein
MLAANRSAQGTSTSDPGIAIAPQVALFDAPELELPLHRSGSNRLTGYSQVDASYENPFAVLPAPVRGNAGKTDGNGRVHTFETLSGIRRHDRKRPGFFYSPRPQANNRPRPGQAQPDRPARLSQTHWRAHAGSIRPSRRLEKIKCQRAC